MSCLDDILCGKRIIIGVKDYADCAMPESGLFFNDLPGITLKSAAQVADEHFQTGAELLRSKQKLAAKLVFKEFSEKMSAMFDFNNIIELREVTRFSSYETLPAANLERGITVSRWRSEIARTFIEEIFVKADDSGVATIKIIDGQVTKEFTADLIAGQIYTIRADYQAESESVKIVFNQQTFRPFTCEIAPAGNIGGCGSCGSRNSQARRGLLINGWNGMQEQNRCFGVGVRAHVKCDENKIICSLLPRMHFLIWYRSGMEYLKHELASERMSPIAMFGAEKAEKTFEALTLDYHKTYAQFVKASANFLRTTKGECFNCNPSISYVESAP